LQQWRACSCRPAFPRDARQARQGRIDDARELWWQVRITCVPYPLRVATVDDESGPLQHGHVSGHPGLRRTEFPHQFADAMLLSVPQQPDGAEARRFGESRKQAKWVWHAIYIRLRAYAGIRIYTRPGRAGLGQVSGGWVACVASRSRDSATCSRIASSSAARGKGVGSRRAPITGCTDSTSIAADQWSASR